MDSEQYNSIHSCTSSLFNNDESNVDSTDSLYSSGATTSQIYELYQKLFSLWRGSSTLHDYYGDLHEIMDEIV